MRKLLRFTLVGTIMSAALLSLAAPRLTSASCIQQTAEEQFAQAEIVAKATITKIDSGPSATTVTAVVDEAMKGPADQVITFVTGYGTTVSTSVDMLFNEGAQYQLYLYRDQDGALTTNVCAGTVLISAAVPTGPTNVVATAPVDTVSYSWFIAAHLLALAVICIVLAIIFHRRNVRNRMSK